MRGPAIPPSLVTCPTRMQAIRRSLASLIRAEVASRTWVTPETTPSTPEEVIVWMESTTSSSGDTCSAWATTAATSDSAARKTPGLTEPTRSARARTCSTLSSPVT